MDNWEFQYYIKSKEETMDEVMLLTEVVPGVNRVMAEEAFLDILMDRDTDPSCVVILSVEKSPETEPYFEEEIGL